MEERGKVQTNVAASQEVQETGDPQENTIDRDKPTPEHVKNLNDNFLLLMEAIYISVDKVVMILRQEKILDNWKTEGILIDSPNRYAKTMKMLEFVRSQTADTNAYNALYKATKEAQLWTAADILYPETAPHGPKAREDEKEEKEETTRKVPLEETSLKERTTLPND